MSGVSSNSLPQYQNMQQMLTSLENGGGEVNMF